MRLCRTGLLINPDEVHTGSKAHDDGWRYRGFYPDNTQVLGALQELGLARSGMPSFAVSVLDDPRLHTAFLQLHRLLERLQAWLQQRRQPLQRQLQVDRYQPVEVLARQKSIAGPRINQRIQQLLQRGSELELNCTRRLGC